MILEAKTDQSVNKNYKYKFSDNISTYLKQCKQIVNVISLESRRELTRKHTTLLTDNKLIYIVTKRARECER